MQVTLEEAEDDAEDKSYVVTVDDITDLVQAQRSSAWADVARRIAHEIKNPLTPIQLSAERIRRRYGKVITEDREVFDQCTDTIIRQVDDIGRMVDEFSAFARMPKPDMQIDRPARSVARSVVPGRRSAAPTSRSSAISAREPLMGTFDSRLMAQAFGNVIKNAAEAIEAVERENGQTGVIRVEARADDGNDPRRRDRQRQGPAARKSPAAARALHDDAREGHRPRPRHRQEDRRGPWRRARTARRAGRFLRRRRGAMISMILPDGAGDSAAAGSDAGRLTTEKLKRSVMASDILIVDDEEDIRELVAGILSDEGHETRTARDSDSALAAIADRVPRLVFLDIWLQGSKLDGLALLDQIKTMHPNLVQTQS